MISHSTFSKSALRGISATALLVGTAFQPLPAAAAETAAQLSQKLDALQRQLQALAPLQDQVRQLQQQLEEVRKGEKSVETKQQEREAAEREAALAAGGHLIFKDGKSEIEMPAPPSGGVQNKNIKITFGGFIEAAGIYRSKNETADLASTFAGVPFANSPQGHLSELRGSARQSRLSILAQGNLDKDTVLSAWYEMDFLGAAPTANANESNSFNPRIRNIYATIDRNDMGLHILGGQNWSLATLNRTGIMPRTEVAPVGIEAQYVVGFNWTRNPQIRIVKDFDKKVWVGISAESPAAQITQGPGATQAPPLTVNNPGAVQLNNGGGAYSTDSAPDMIAKIAFDPGFGHYELFGITRWFRDRAAFNNQTTNASGVGGSVLVPVIPKQLDFQASFLVGKGMGRYGAGQLADVTTDNLGRFVALPYKSVLLGLVGHPTPTLDLYGYAGTEQLEARYNSVGSNFYGYGNPLAINNTGCYTESAGTCSGNNAREYEITGGLWYKFYQGSIGYMQFGFQDQYVKRYVFAGATTPGAHTSDNIAMVSFRYYPF